MTATNEEAPGLDAEGFEISAAPSQDVPNSEQSTASSGSAATGHDRWLPLWLLRVEIGPLMRDSLLRKLSDREREASGRVMLDEMVVRGQRQDLVHPELADAVRRWYRDQDLLISTYVPSLAGSAVIVDAAGITVRHTAPMTPADARRVGLRLLEAATSTPRVLLRSSAVDEALRQREGGV